MIFTKPKTIDEYLDIVDQAIFEIDELLMCAEDVGEMDYQLTEMARVYEHLAKILKDLHINIKDGKHQFADSSDLAFMSIVNQARNAIPFADLLELLNDTHRSGIES